MYTLYDLPADRLVDSRTGLFVAIDACELCRRSLTPYDVRTHVFVDGVRKVACAECGVKYCENCRSALASMHLENDLFSGPYLVCDTCGRILLKKGTAWRVVSIWSSVPAAF